MVLIASFLQVPAPATEPDGGRELSHATANVIVLLGASYARGWGLDSSDGLQVVNRGVDGEESWQMLARFDDDVTALQPRAVILWGYINDIHRSEPGKLEQTKDRARESFEEMVALARRNGIEPILATEVTIRGRDSWSESLAGFFAGLMGKESYQDQVNGHVRELNRWLRGYAEQEGLLLLDLEPVLSDESGTRKKEFAKEDGSHIPQAGYDALTAAFADLLTRHIEASEPAS